MSCYILHIYHNITPPYDELSSYSALLLSSPLPLWLRKTRCLFVFEPPAVYSIEVFWETGTRVGKHTGGEEWSPKSILYRGTKKLKISKMFSIFFHLSSLAMILCTNRSCGDGGAIRGLPCDIRDRIARSNNW